MSSILALSIGGAGRGGGEGGTGINLGTVSFFARMTGKNRYFVS